jgi:hypothetical protein
VAFIRKHRERYWLVHNFRVGHTVRQVRIYPFDLHADPEHEIAQAQGAADSLYPGQIAPTWVTTVRQQLQQLRAELLQARWESQAAQIAQQMQALLQALESFDGPAMAKQRLLQECMAQCQSQLAREATEVTLPALPPQPMPLSPAPSSDSTPGAAEPPQALGEGFYLCDQTIYHCCAAGHAWPDSTDSVAVAPVSTARSAVVWVSLLNGRDLWLECQVCHTRWSDMARVEPYTPLKMHHQHISKFDRFCAEHAVGDACSILVQYRSGRVERLQGTVQAIDYAGKKVQVATTQGKPQHTYWRHVDRVYFGDLEVRLTEAQRAQFVASGKGEPRSLGHTWYALADTPDIRLFLQHLGIRY